MEPVAPFSDFGEKRVSDLMSGTAFFACYPEYYRKAKLFDIFNVTSLFQSRNQKAQTLQGVII